MARVFVADTSILVDLHRGHLLETVWRLPYEFAVPDLLFETELRPWEGSVLRHRLTIQALDGEGMRLVAVYQRADARLSVPDVFALALAKRCGYPLLTGDAGLRAIAKLRRWSAMAFSGYWTK